MPDRLRFVFDTNVLISALLLPTSIPRRALRRVLSVGVLLQSEATLREVAGVIRRDKLQRYVTSIERDAFLRALIGDCEIATPLDKITICRDPADDKFLELALAGKATAIVSGDQDLLALGSFRDVDIITPAQFLERFG